LTLVFMLALVGCRDEGLPHFGKLQYTTDLVELDPLLDDEQIPGVAYPGRATAALRSRVLA
jgi:hypothetical protein